MAEPKDLNLVITEDRINSMDLETFYNVEGSVKATIDFVAHFVADEKEQYLDKKEAVLTVTRGRTIGDIGDIAQSLRDAMETKAVPKN